MTATVARATPQRAWEEAHREERRAYQREWRRAKRARDPEAARIRDRASYAQRRERINAGRAEWRGRNREHLRHQQNAYQREWVARNPRRERLNHIVETANRTARRLGLPGRLRIRDVEHLLLECVYCGTTEQLTLDHATPLIRGGENHWSNVTIACSPCNNKKNRRTVAEYRAVLKERAA